MPAIAFDATPLTPLPGAFGGHAVRGIGRYLTSVLRSLADQRPAWVAENVVVVRSADMPLPWWVGGEIVTRRLRVRPQDVAWLSAPVLDRLVLERGRIGAWTTTDPTAPLRPPGTGRSVVLAYDLIPLSVPGLPASMRPHRRLVYRLYLRRLQRADLVIAISHTVAGDLTRQLRIPKSRIAVVYPGLTQPSNDAAAGTPQRPLDLLFAGVPAPHKNAGSAIDMLAELRRRGCDIRLRFVGTQPPPARRALAERAARLGVANWVEHLDHVPDERLSALYRESVLVAPSTIEGLGLGPIEAVLAGGRAVCGPAPVFRETLGDAVTYADADDATAMADAYERASADEPPAEQRAALAERFGPAASASAAVTAFERLRSSPAE